MSGPREPGREDAFAGGPYDLNTPPDWATFPGLYPPLYTQTPDAFFDWVAPFLPEIELRVLIYLIRRTLGFKKQGDQITVEQIATGIVTRDGARLDWGTQLGERSVQRALSGLETKGLIERHLQIDAERGCRPSYIRLRLCDQSGSDWQARRNGGHMGGAPADTREAPDQTSDSRLNRHRPGVPLISPSPQVGGVRRDTYKRQSSHHTDQQETDPLPPTQETDRDSTGDAGPLLWDQIKHELAAILAPRVYSSRVAATVQLSGDDRQLVVQCPDSQTSRWLERSLGRKTAEIAALFVDNPPEIRFVAAE